MEFFKELLIIIMILRNKELLVFSPLCPCDKWKGSLPGLVYKSHTKIGWSANPHFPHHGGKQVHPPPGVEAEVCLKG